MKDRNGKNVSVAIEPEKQIQEGVEYLDVNDVRSFHGREFKNIVDPIVNNHTLKWVDKETDSLISPQRPGTFSRK